MGDVIRIPFSELFRTALLLEIIVSDTLLAEEDFDALDTFILVSPFWYSSSVNLNSSKLSTNSLINYLSIFIFYNFFKSFSG